MAITTRDEAITPATAASSQLAESLQWLEANSADPAEAAGLASVHFMANVAAMRAERVLNLGAGTLGGVHTDDGGVPKT